MAIFWFTIYKEGKISRIVRFHDDDIWLQLPEFISFFAFLIFKTVKGLNPGVLFKFVDPAGD